MSIGALFIFCAGLVLLIGGAELLVRGASRLAFALGISPLVVGLTVVAFGTSAPELAVSIHAAFNNQASLALGNVIGSNIFNILLILGVSAVITPLTVHVQLIRLDIPLLIGSSLLVVLFSTDGSIGRAEGLTLFAAGLIYTGFLIRQSRRENAQEQPAATSSPTLPHTIQPATESQHSENRSAFQWRNVAFVVIGLILLVWGARWLVQSATAMAQALGISQLVIGLTIIAGGTSLPEVATSVVAALRGERDIAVGNVVGSNLFNLLVVLALSATIAPTGIVVPDTARIFDLPIMTVVAIVCFPIFFTGYRIARWEGLVFLAYYLAYVIYLILQPGNSDTFLIFREMFLYFALPLTLITLAISLGRELRNRRNRLAP